MQEIVRFQTEVRIREPDFMSHLLASYARSVFLPTLVSYRNVCRHGVRPGGYIESCPPRVVLCLVMFDCCALCYITLHIRVSTLVGALLVK